MGAYQIFQITFLDKETRDYFENKVKKEVDFILSPRRLFQYKWNNEYECTYYMGWDGYGLGMEVLTKLDKAKKLNKIKSFISMDLTTAASWHNELKVYKTEYKD